MANVDGGTLSFKSIMDNDQLIKAVDESLKRIQGLSDGTVAGGKAMDEAFQKTADDISRAYQQIDNMSGEHKAKLQELESEYNRLGEAAAKALKSGNDDEYFAITQRQTAIKGEVAVRKQLLKEIEGQADALAKTEEKMESERKKIEENSNAQVSMRTRIKELREEMMLLIDQGIDEQSEAYKRLEAELGRLTDIQGDVNQQARILANDEAQFQGIIAGLSGLSGGFSAATGAISFFAGENENLQKIMVKVQSLMAITIGLQQVSQTLNKDSAFQLVTMNKLKNWWNGLLEVGAKKTTTETAATVANTAAKKGQATATTQAATAETIDTAAKGANTVAATAGTVANIGLAGAFRMVGAAIKSIPVIGWILAGISALIGIVSTLTSKAREAKKASEEFNNSLIENTYKSIGSIENLSYKWNQLGDDLDSKKKFIEENKKAFDELGVAIRDVADAEKLLNAGKKDFIDAQIAKATAAIYLQQVEEKIKEKMELQKELDSNSTNSLGFFQQLFSGGNYVIKSFFSAKNSENLKKEIAVIDGEMKTFQRKALESEAEFLEKMKELGINFSNTYDDGTIGTLEQAISKKQELIKNTNADDKDKINQLLEEIKADQKKLDALLGKKTDGGTQKDPFLEKLENQKKEYQRFMKWVNSGDETLAKAANQEFEGLLKEGSTYIDYLKKQREIIESVDISNRTKTQNAQLRTLNNQIAEETKKTVLESFNTELSAQLSNANTIMEMLNIIEKRRKELANDGTELDNAKGATLDDAEKDVMKQVEDEYKKAKEEYNKYLDEKIDADTRYLNKRRELEKQLDEETDLDKRKALETQIKSLDIQNDTRQQINYDTLLTEYQSFQEKRQAMSDDFDKKIALATEKKNDELVKRLEEAKAKALSELDISNLTDSKDWNQLFGNLDKLTVSKMIELRNKLESEWGKLNLSPEQLDALRKKIEEVNNTIAQKNPFAGLVDAIKRYKNKEKDVDFKDIAKSAGESLDLVKQSFDSVVNGLTEMGVAGDETTQQLLGDISNLIGSASELATGIATGNPFQIIQGSIGVITSAMNVFDSGSNRRNKRLEKEIEYYNALVDVYDTLIDKQKALTESLSGKEAFEAYQEGADMIKAQVEAAQKSLQSWFSSGASWKSHSKGYKYNEDQGKFLSQAALFNMDATEWEKWRKENVELWNKLPNQVKDYAQAVMDAGDAMTELERITKEAALGFSLDEASNSLMGLVSQADLAFEDISKSFENHMQKAILRTIQTQIMSDGMKKWYENFSEAMTNDSELSAEEAEALRKEYEAIINEGREAYEAALAVIGTSIEELNSTTSGSGSPTDQIKSVTEETASYIVGQMNAVRMNQLETAAVLRQQLASLSIIAINSKFIEQIYLYLKNNTDPNRSQGLV